MLKIHDHIFKGSKLSASLGQELPRKAHRLIIRNISFATTEKEILDKFGSFGEIVEIHMPKKPDGSIVGFCFVQYLNKSNADEAISKLNAVKFNGRKIAVDYAMAKTPYEKAKDADEVSDLSRNMEGTGDMSRSANEIEDATKDTFESNEEDVMEMEPDNCDVVSNASSDTCSEEDEETDCIRGDIENIGEDSMNGPGHYNKTLFVRNLLFETELQKVTETFSKFGKLRYVRLVKDSIGRSKGCAFVSFVNTEDATRCLEAFKNSTRPPLFVENSSQSKNSKISLDLYGQADSAWIIDGRHIDVLQAIPKLTAREIASKTAEDKKEADKRNLYLLKESFIDKSSSEWQEMSETDKQKRAKAYQERALKLKNLNCFVSKTRISIRNMPVSIDEKQLKATIGTCVSKSHPEFKLTSQYIKQVKIIRDKERKTSAGESRSLGYAFVEFSDHKYALSLVRKMNNKKDIFTTQKRPIVEFAIENSTILAKRQERVSSPVIKSVDLKKRKRLPSNPNHSKGSTKHSKKPNQRTK